MPGQALAQINPLIGVAEQGRTMHGGFLPVQSICAELWALTMFAAEAVLGVKHLFGQVPSAAFTSGCTGGAGRMKMHWNPGLLFPLGQPLLTMHSLPAAMPRRQSRLAFCTLAKHRPVHPTV